MLIKSLKQVVATVSAKATLRSVLIVPFILQIVGAVGLVGYLSFRNGQQAVNEVASQLRREISDRTSDQIKTYLKTPHLINATNADAIRLAQLDIKNPQALERHFLKQIQVFNSLSRIYFSNPQGGLISVGHDERGLTVAFTENFARSILRVYGVDSQGNRQKLLVNQQQYDARERPFYQKALDVGRPTWCPIYIYVPSSRGLGIAASYPFYDEAGKFQGVLSSDLSLVAINNFLQSLKIGTQGQVFIIERSGMIVASSIPELPFVSNVNGKDKKRLKATEIKNPLIRSTAKHLISNIGSLTKINASKQLDFEIEGKRQFAQVTPFKDEFGLDWLIVVVVPEADFMKQINANTHTTILLCIAAFLVATGIGIITARWITKPILRLNTAAKEIARGEWDKTVEIKRSDEVGQLAKSFNRMAAQLQTSFAELSSLNEALRTSDRKFRAIFNQTFQFTGMLSVDGIVLEVNQTALSFGGLQRDDVIGKPFGDCYWWSISQQTQNQLKAAINRAVRGEFIRYEVDVFGADNRVITIDFSLKPIFDEQGNVDFLILEGRDISERQQSQKILADYNRTLEAQVAERTAELININEQLKHEITERKWAEAEIIRSKDLLESIFNESADAIFLVNTDTQLITDCNRRAVELFEAQDKDELINIEGRTLQRESFTQDELKSIVDEISLKGFWSLELEYVSKKGKLFWGNLAVKQIYVGGQKMNLVRVTDITARKQAEEALRESKRFIERIADASPNLWYIYDHIEQRNVYTNRELASVLGYTPQQMQAMGSGLLPAIVHPDDLATFPIHLKKWETATDDDILDIEYRIRNAQGEWRTLLTLETVFERTPDGTVKQVIGTSTDISDRKRIEEALRESALREQAIAHVLQRMRQTLDIDTIFSATTEELRGVLNCDRVVIYRFNPDWSGKFVAESVANGWVTLIAEQKNDPHLKEDAVEDENCLVKTLNIENDSVQDTYLQNTRGGAYSQGVNYRVTEDIYKAGFTPCYINLLERFQVRAYLIVPIFCGSKLWGLLATYQNSNPRCWSEAQISAVVQIGVQLGIALQQAQLLQHTQQQAVALKLALDELKRTQAQLIQTEKMSSLGRMVAGIAHEINNPVSFIYGNLTPARQYVQDLLNLIELYQQTYPHPTSEIQQLESEIEVDFLVEDWQRLIDSMQVGAERIREIVLSLRNFSRLDEQELKTVDIHEGIDSTLLILQHRLKANGNAGGIEVIKNYGQLPRVSCYASQLNQVFMNLLSNAIDALETQAPPHVITISTSSNQKSVEICSNTPVLCQEEAASCPIPEWVIIRIADNGSGMSEAVKKKIFDPFFTTKPVGSGTGLGLAISYQIIVEKHKGQIRCISAPGKGTEFIVEIPVSQGQESIT